MTDTKKDEPEDSYRDDPSLFAKGADSAQRSAGGTSSGGGPETSATPTTSMSKGSQAEWQQPDAAKPAASDDTNPASRSDDPGQSSYGGFKDEGPADNRNHAPDAEDAPATTQATNVAANADDLHGDLFDDADETDGGASKVAPNNPQSPDDRDR